MAANPRDLISAVTGRARKLARRDHPRVSVIRLSGVISSAASPGRGGLNLAALAGPIEAAFRVRDVKAVALAINSPGGSPVQSALIHQRIRALADEKNVPVYAFAEDVAASGGYWLAVAADQVYADRNSIIGSIGVISAGFGFTGLIEKLGIERRLYAQGDNKSMLDPFQPEKPEDVERLHAIQKEMHESFKALVKARRGERLPKRKDKQLFNGDIWTGNKALDLGLIDGVGDLRGVMREKFGDKVKFKVFGPRQNWLQRRFGLSRPAEGWPAADPSDWADNLIDALIARAHWARFGL